MKNLFLVILLCMSLSSCSRLASNTALSSRAIVVGPGPEDMAIDSSLGTVRILISASERRAAKPFGEILQFDPVTKITKEFKRVGTPDSIVLRPHGMDIVQLNGIPYLYVISHDYVHKYHYVLKYKITKDVLIFEEAFQNKLMDTPNDIIVSPEGRIYASNDAFDKKKVLAQLLKYKRSSVVMYDPHTKIWKQVANKIVYANGLEILNNKLYLATTRSNRLFEYSINPDGTLDNRKTLIKIPGLDNIILDGESLIFTSHPKLFAFIKHVSKPDYPSPSMVHKFTPATMQYQLLFADDGTRISAASTALILKNKLYISQIFNPFILEVDIDK